MSGTPATCAATCCRRGGVPSFASKGILLAATVGLYIAVLGALQRVLVRTARRHHEETLPALHMSTCDDRWDIEYANTEEDDAQHRTGSIAPYEEARQTRPVPPDAEHSKEKTESKHHPAVQEEEEEEEEGEETPASLVDSLADEDYGNHTARARNAVKEGEEPGEPAPLVDFAIVGFAKCGTGSLLRFLNIPNKIYMGYTKQSGREKREMHQNG